MSYDLRGTSYDLLLTPVQETGRKSYSSRRNLQGIVRSFELQFNQIRVQAFFQSG